MTSATRGRRTFPVEVTNVTPRGFWLLVDDGELFMAFAEFPWFREGSIAAIFNVERATPHHLYWPALDIDLAVESIEHPERYPLIARRL